MRRGTWLCRFLILAAYAQGADSKPAEYADPAVCAECHTQIAQTYAKTGMARSFRSPGNSSRPELEGAAYYHAASREDFASLSREGAYYIRRTNRGPRDEPTNAFEERIDYVIGSGECAVSYLHRTRDNQLVEFPITWYPQGGRWGMSPGYDRPEHPGFSRAISYRCMFCHNAYPEVASGPGNWDGATVFPAKLPQGIDCQRCHGPAAAHVAAALQGKPLSEIRAGIVNPARLTPERQMEVCMQCHLETTSAILPGAIMRLGREVFSYRPGEPLADYMLYFDHAPGTAHDDKFEFVSSAYRLRKSACFNASEGRLPCTTCHDPHRELSREEELEKTDRACAGCHETAIAALRARGRHPAAADCASCHMPLRQGVDAIHITITDHLIQRPASVPPAVPAVEMQDGNTLPYAGEVAPYYPKVVDPLEAAIAQVRGLANLPEGLNRLENLLEKTHPRSAEPYIEMGGALLGTRQAARSIPFYEKAAALEPGNWRCLYGLAQALQATGKWALAAAALERAAAQAPEETKVLLGLGVDYALTGRTRDAVRVLRDVVSRNPEDATAQNDLGEALRPDNLVDAEPAFREAVRIQPEAQAFRMNLADVLMQFGQFREAALHLDAAIRGGPATEDARSAWYTALAATGSVAEARAHYDESLRKQTSEAHDRLGNALISLGDSGGAIQEYREALTSDSQSARAAVNLGIALAREKQTAEARKWLEDGLRMNPRQPAAQLVLGQILMASGLREEGMAHLRLAASGDDPGIRSAAEQLLKTAQR